MTLLPRLQLVELEDQVWFPSVIRGVATDYLRFVEVRVGVHRHVFPVLRDAMARTGATRVLDLCSGGGGRCLVLQRELTTAGLSVRFTRTDLFPNVAARAALKEESGGWVDFIAAPVNAIRVPEELAGFLTFFNSFHHFRPADARAIIADAVAHERPIAIFEVPHRALLNLVGLLLTPLWVWLATPFIRPFKLNRILWTYLIPVVPLTCFWDGFVSHLRAYTAGEMLEFAQAGRASHHEWHFGENRVPPTPLKVTYLGGYPLARTGVAGMTAGLQ